MDLYIYTHQYKIFHHYFKVLVSTILQIYEVSDLESFTGVLTPSSPGRSKVAPAVGASHRAAPCVGGSR